MMSIRYWILACVLWFPILLNAQETAVSLLLDNLELLSDEEDKDWSDEFESLSYRLDNPLNLNEATREQLSEFPFLTDIQREYLEAYIYLHGPMQTLAELQLVKHMDVRTIDLLTPFVCVLPPPDDRRFPSLKQLLADSRSELLTRLDIPFYTRKGYKRNYLGTPLYHSLRYGVRYADRLRAGFTAEKDAGEPMWALHNAKGYDSYGFHFMLRDAGRLKTLAIGNYRLGFGKGLVLGDAFRMGKAYSLSGVQEQRGIRPHTSTAEYDYFCGAALQVEAAPHLLLSAFYSRRLLDGTLRNDTLRTISKTGLHRTHSEAQRRDAATLQLWGIRADYSLRTFQVGITGIYYAFNRPYFPTLAGYARYNLRGSRFFNAGIDYKYRSGQFMLSGEAATNIDGYALLNRLSYDFSSCKAMLIHRLYTHTYNALFARSFSEGSATQNENGWYVACEASLAPGWRLFASADLFSFPWWKYRISKPSSGVDAMWQVVYTPNRRNTLSVNHRYKRKQRDLPANHLRTTPVGHHRFRLRWTQTVGGGLTSQTTFHCNRFHHDGQSPASGYGFTQSCTYDFSFPLKLSVQGTYFSTGNYDARVYVPEGGLLYTYHTPAYYGRGFRFATTIRYDCNSVFVFLLKLGHTHYQDRESIGSGNDLIAGNRKTDLQMQLRAKF